MAILIEGYSVVVRNSTVAGKYPGGMDAYRRDCPNNTFCADTHLCRIGFMVPGDADAFVADLAAKGLTPYRQNAAEDVALVSQSDGLVRPCSWLELRQEGDAFVASLVGTAEGELHTPPGWSPEGRLQYLSAEEAKERLEFVRSDQAVDVYRDKMTGKEVYVGRTGSMSDQDKTRHDQLYQQACALIDGLLILGDQPPGPLDPPGRQRLQETIPLFAEVVQINPANWSAMWLLGKVSQRLGDYESGLKWFARAHRINPDQPDVAREAAIAAMDAGKPEEAVGFCRRALEVKPDDAGLRSNLAVALLFSGKPADAQTAVREALQRDPADTITAGIARIVDEVLSGARPCPRHVRDLQGNGSGPAAAPAKKRPWWRFWA